MQPVTEQCSLASIVQAKQVGQWLDVDGGVGAFRHRAVGSRVKRKLGWRRIAAIRAGKATHHIEATDFERPQALTQCGLQGVLPTLLDMNTAPQALQATQAVLFQPRLELAIGFDFFLQGLEGLHAGRQVGAFGRLGIDSLLQGAPFFIQLRHGFGEFMQAGLRFGLRFLGTAELRSEVGQARFIGGIERVAVRRQAFIAQGQRARLLLDVALVSGQHLNLLLDLGHTGALLVGLGLGLAQRFFKRRQLGLVLFGLRRQQLGLFFGLDGLGGQTLGLRSGVFLACRPLRRLLLELGQTLLDAQPAIDDEADFSLQPPYFRAGFIKFALGLIDLVTRRIVRLANGFQVGLNVAQVGDTTFEIIHRLLGVHLDPGLVGLALGTFQEPQLVLLEGAVSLQRVVAHGHFGLLFQVVEVGIEFAQDVFYSRQVFPGIRQPVGGLPAAFLVFGDACGLFQKEAQLFRFGFDDAADGALTNDGVGPRAEAGAQKHVLDIAAAYRLVVDVIAGGAVPGQNTLDGDLGKLAPLAASAVVGIVKHQLHAGAARRLARVGAVENDVLHGLAAQLRCLALTQHPADGVHDVRFAATVGANHTDQLPWQHEIGGLRERFKP